MRKTERREKKKLLAKMHRAPCWNIWRSRLEGPRAGRGGMGGGGGGGEGRGREGKEKNKNMPALIVCILAQGLHDGQAFSRPAHYSIKERGGTELER